MNTKILEISIENPQKDKLEQAGKILREGGLVAFPTETVYGLGANALDENAVNKIFIAKGRPSDNPLIVHVSDMKQVEKLTKFIPQKAKKVMDAFWPGPVTIILEKSEIVPKCTTAGLETVAIRMPSHKIALELIKESSVPIAAPSANTSGKPSPTTFKHVKEDMIGKIEAIVDGGRAGIGLESTVIDMTSDVPTILRPGGVTKEDLLELFDEVKMDPALHDANAIPKSPGQKYKHYSPKADVYLVDGDEDDIAKKILKMYKKITLEGKKVGIMSTKQTLPFYEDMLTINVGDRNEPETIAGNLFRTLREFDELNVDIILAESIEKDGIGAAIMNRLNKSAGGKIITAREE